jgi:hypothetical protein
VTAQAKTTGTPNAAVPNGSPLPAAAIQGELSGSPIPIEPSVDGALYLAAEIIWPEIWPARSNLDLWGTGPDGTYAWRNQCDGVFEGDRCLL